jgi:SPX domain protein involved in polyphosphate accumulation
MKFGEKLNNALYEPWRFYYLDYNGLKKAIREDRPGTFNENDEATFVNMLEKELDKVSLLVYPPYIY